MATKGVPAIIDQAVVPNVVRRGWYFPLNASVGHYFMEEESLCGNYVLPFGASCTDVDVILVDEDCSLCAKMLPEVRKGTLIQTRPK